MSIDDLKSIIEEFHAQGYNDAQISVAFAKMYLADQCNYRDLEVILPYLNMRIDPKFAAMTDAERKDHLRKAIADARKQSQQQFHWTVI